MLSSGLRFEVAAFTVLHEPDKHTVRRADPGVQNPAHARLGCPAPRDLPALLTNPRAAPRCECLPRSAQLQKDFKRLPTIPKKKMYGNFEPAFLRKRMALLQGMHAL